MRLALALAAMLVAGPAFAESVTTATGDPAPATATTAAGLAPATTTTAGAAAFAPATATTAGRAGFAPGAAADAALAEPTPIPVPGRIPESRPASGDPRVRPWAAGLASAIIPGGGFFYLHRFGRGAAYFGIESAELAATVVTLSTSGYDPTRPETNDRANRIVLPGLWLQDTHLTGIYDAYRAARIARGNEGYRTPIPEPGVDGLLRAPFEWRTLRRPRVALPVTAVAAAGVALSYWYRDHAPKGAPTFWQESRVPLFSRELPRDQVLPAALAWNVGSFYIVGVGEEALFRGVIQTTFDEWLGPVGGIAASSVVFGLAHFGNYSPNDLAAGVGQVAITTLLGGYLGWMYWDDGYDLRANVAFHCWYDVAVGAAAFLLDPRHYPISASISIPF